MVSSVQVSIVTTGLHIGYKLEDELEVLEEHTCKINKRFVVFLGFLRGVFLIPYIHCSH